MFGRKPDPKEQMRENRRNLNKANRELETDRRAMERRERELENEIKKLAKQGHTDACRKLAKQLVQIRNQKTKSVQMSANISGINAQNSHMYSMGKMAQVMGTTAATMKTMDKQMPMTRVMKDMRDFNMAQEKMGLTEEMMNDQLDSMFSEPGDEAEQDAIVAKVLDEIGIEVNGKFAQVPSMPTSLPKTAEKNMTDEDMERMLAQLRAS